MTLIVVVGLVLVGLGVCAWRRDDINRWIARQLFIEIPAADREPSLVDRLSAPDPQTTQGLLSASGPAAADAGVSQTTAAPYTPPKTARPVKRRTAPAKKKSASRKRSSKKKSKRARSR